MRARSVARSLLGLALLVGCDDSLDLKGLRRTAGERVRHEISFSMHDGILSIPTPEGIGRNSVGIKTQVVEDVEVLAAAKGKPTKYLQQVVSNLTVMSAVGGDEVVHDPLENELVLHELRNGTWRQSLVRRTGMVNPPGGLAPKAATADQQVALKESQSFEAEDPVAPPGDVAVGDVWTLKNAAIARLLGPQISEPSGTATLTFAKVADFDGEKCARIEVTVDASGRMPGLGDQTLTVALEASGTIYRSLATGLDRHSRITGKMTCSAASGNAGAARVKLEGPVVMEMSSRLISTPVNSGSGGFRAWLDTLPARVWMFAKEQPMKAFLCVAVIAAICRSVDRGLKHMKHRRVRRTG